MSIVPPNMTHLPRFQYFVALSELHDPASIREAIAPLSDGLDARGGAPWQRNVLHAPVPFIVVVGTGGTERAILDAVGVRGREPVLLVAHPGHNSLPAALEVLARLQQEEIPGEIIFQQSADDSAGWARLETALEDLRVRSQLRCSRIGHVGGASEWLVASTPWPEAIRSTWGPEVVHVPIGQVLEEIERAAQDSGAALAADLTARAAGVLEPSESDISVASRVAVVLRTLVEESGFQAVAVKCFDLVTRLRTSGCFALSLLNDAGVMAGCEGDLPSTVTMLWLRTLLSLTPWMANPARLDPIRGTVTLAHCMVPRTVARSYRVRSHFESGLGVSLQGTLQEGPVTLVRIGGTELDRIWVCEGNLIANTDCKDLCRTQVEVVLGPEPIDQLLRAPLGNHVVMVPGHHAARIQRSHRVVAGVSH